MSTIADHQSVVKGSHAGLDERTREIIGDSPGVIDRDDAEHAIDALADLLVASDDKVEVIMRLLAPALEAVDRTLDVDYQAVEMHARRALAAAARRRGKLDAFGLGEPVEPPAVEPDVALGKGADRLKEVTRDVLGFRVKTIGEFRKALGDLGALAAACGGPVELIEKLVWPAASRFYGGDSRLRRMLRTEIRNAVDAGCRKAETKVEREPDDLWPVPGDWADPLGDEVRRAIKGDVDNKEALFEAAGWLIETSCHASLPGYSLIVDVSLIVHLLGASVTAVGMTPDGFARAISERYGPDFEGSNNLHYLNADPDYFDRRVEAEVEKRAKAAKKRGGKGAEPAGEASTPAIEGPKRKKPAALPPPKKKPDPIDDEDPFADWGA